MTENRLRIVFMGTPDFAVPSLEYLLAGDDEVALVITQPDRPKGRGRKLCAPPVKELARRHGIPVLQTTKIKSTDFLEELAAVDADIFVVVAFGRILPAEVLALPPLGTINVHGSLLPKYRGAAPIQRALIKGESETGVTIMQMDEGMDTGDILLMEKMSINDDDTSGSLFEKLAVLGGQALVKALDLARQGRLVPQKQEDLQATEAPLLCKHEGLVDWNQPAQTVSCLLRGLDPWPTASVTLAGKRLRLFAPRVIDSSTVDLSEKISREPGTLCRAGADGLLIAAGRDYLLIREVQPEGGRRMSVDSYLKGHPLKAGLKLGQ